LNTWVKTGCAVVRSIPGLTERSGEGNAQLYSVCYWGEALTVKRSTRYLVSQYKGFPNDISHLQTA